MPELMATELRGKLMMLSMMMGLGSRSAHILAMRSLYLIALMLLCVNLNGTPILGDSFLDRKEAEVNAILRAVEANSCDSGALKTCAGRASCSRLACHKCETSGDLNHKCLGVANYTVCGTDCKERMYSIYFDTSLRSVNGNTRVYRRLNENSDADYDPRVRPWFRKSIYADKVIVVLANAGHSMSDKLIVANNLKKTDISNAINTILVVSETLREDSDYAHVLLFDGDQQPHRYLSPENDKFKSSDMSDCESEVVLYLSNLPDYYLASMEVSHRLKDIDALPKYPLTELTFSRLPDELHLHGLLCMVLIFQLSRVVPAHLFFIGTIIINMLLCKQSQVLTSLGFGLEQPQQLDALCCIIIAFILLFQLSQDSVARMWLNLGVAIIFLLFQQSQVIFTVLRSLGYQLPITEAASSLLPDKRRVYGLLSMNLTMIVLFRLSRELRFDWSIDSKMLQYTAVDSGRVSIVGALEPTFTFSQLAALPSSSNKIFLSHPIRRDLKGRVTHDRIILLSRYVTSIESNIESLGKARKRDGKQLGLSSSSYGRADSSNGIASSAYDGMEIFSTKLAYDSGKLGIHVSSDVPGSVAANSFRSKDEVICDYAVDSNDTMPWHEQWMEPTRVLEREQSAAIFNLLLQRMRDYLSLQGTKSKDLEGEMPQATPPIDDLMTMFAPLFLSQINSALEPVLGRVVFALQSQGEEEQKQRQKLIALEEKKLALRRQKIQHIKRRRACRFQPTRRVSSAKLLRLTIPRGLRLQTSSRP